MIAGIELGLIYAVMALGVYLTFRVLDFPDLTVDQSFTTGAATSAMVILNGGSPWIATVVGFVAGGLAACGSGDDRPAAGSASEPATAASSPATGPPASPSTSAPSLACLPGGRSLPGAHGTNATVTGRGATAVVFVNTADGTACDWAGYAKTLVEDGTTVVAYDYATPDGPLADRQRELRGVVAGAKAQGADRVVVMYSGQVVEICH